MLVAVVAWAWVGRWVVGRAAAQPVSQDVAMCALSASLGTLPSCHGSSPLTPVCSWPSVSCVNGRVLHLPSLTLSASTTLPSEIGLLTDLNYLNLQGVGVSVVLPSEIGESREVFRGSSHRSSTIGQLSALTHLELSGLGLPANGFPRELGNTPLHFLVIAYNPLRGTLPSALGGLLGLQHLQLTSSSFTGSIPSFLGGLTQLTYLQLQDTLLSGDLPAALFAPQLTYVLVVNNRIRGTIPSEVGNMSNLVVLQLSGNSLSGVIPTEIGSLAEMYFLDLSDNSLVGTIPTEIGTPALYMHCHDCSCDTGLPYTLGNLNFSRNFHTGGIPTAIGDALSSFLESVDFSHNRLTGSLPTELGIAGNFLSFLDLSHNSFSGSIPSSLMQSEFLTYLDLANNNLNGLLSLSGALTFWINANCLIDLLEKASNLNFLNLKNNSLVGAIPSEIGYHSLFSRKLHQRSRRAAELTLISIPLPQQSHRRHPQRAFWDDFPRPRP